MVRYFFSILVLVAIIIISTLGIHDHELVHQRINAKYGVDSYVDWFKDPFFVYTVPYNLTEYKTKCTEECQKLHIQNEIEAYNNGSFYMFIYLAVLLFFIMIERRMSTK